MNTQKNKIIVYGGTGYYGSKVVLKLANKSAAVKVVSRNYEKAKEKFGDKVEILVGDVTHKDFITESLHDVKAIVICLSAMNRKQIRQMKLIERDAVITIMEEAKKAGIKRLVYMSGYEIREQLLRDLNIIEFGEIKLEIESRISHSDFNWTILGDSPSFEVFFAFVRNGKMAVPGGGFNPIPCISDEDVGEITAQTVLRDDLKNMRLKLTGPEAYSFPHAAKLFSEITGKKIKHITIPLFIFNAISIILFPFNPFLRFLYKSLRMLNNFPNDLAVKVPKDHLVLRKLFDYEPVSLEMEIKRRLKENKL